MCRLFYPKIWILWFFSILINVEKKPIWYCVYAVFFIYGNNILCIKILFKMHFLGFFDVSIHFFKIIQHMIIEVYLLSKKIAKKLQRGKYIISKDKWCY